MVLPQVNALGERLLVERFLGERASIVALTISNRAIDGRAERFKFVVGEKIGHDDKTVAPKFLD